MDSHEAETYVTHQPMDDLIPQNYWDTLLESAFDALGGSAPENFEWGCD